MQSFNGFQSKFLSYGKKEFPNENIKDIDNDVKPFLDTVVVQVAKLLVSVRGTGGDGDWGAWERAENASRQHC